MVASKPSRSATCLATQHLSDPEAPQCPHQQCPPSPRPDSLRRGHSDPSPRREASALCQGSGWLPATSGWLPATQIAHSSKDAYLTYHNPGDSVATKPFG